MSTAVAVVLFCRRHRLRRVRRRRLRRRVLGPRRRRRGRAASAPRGDRPLDRPGVGGQPRLADLHLRRAVDRLLRGVRLDHAHAVRAADPRRARASSCAARASRSARRCSAPAIAATSAPPSPSRRCWSRTAWAPSPAAIASGRVPRRRRGRRPVDQLGEPDVDPRRRPRRRRRRLPRRRLPRVGRPPARRRRPWPSTSAAGRSAPPSSPALVALVGIFVLRADARYLFDGLTSRALAARHPLGACAASASLVLLRARRRPRRPAARRSARSPASSSAGASPSGPTSSRRASRCPTRPRPRARSPRSSSPPVGLALDRAPRLRPALRARPEEPAARGRCGLTAVIWHAQQVTEPRIDRFVAIAVAAIVVVLVGLVAALGFMIGWLPAAILFAAVVVVVFMLLVAN